MGRKNRSQVKAFVPDEDPVPPLRIPTPRVFYPLLRPARYKGIWGGRGSGKSHFFAEHMIERCLLERVDAVCLREFQRTLDESVKKLLEDKIQAMGVGSAFDVQHNKILTPHGGRIIFMGMQDQNAHSIKSLEGFDIAWFEEAQTASHRSLELLRPTIRKPGSELWFSWNPYSEDDAVDQFLRGPKPPENAVVIRANWSDNPFFPKELDEERRFDKEVFPNRYQHIWEGAYSVDGGDILFPEERLLLDGKPVEFPHRVDSVFAVIDTAVKDTLEHDSTAVVYFARDRFQPYELLVLDYDITQVEGSLLEEWLPHVYIRLENLSRHMQARYGSLGTWIEDRVTGTVLLQHAFNRGLEATAIDMRLTQLGKEPRAISASPYVYKGKVKISEYAYNKTVMHRGVQKNYLLAQVCTFRTGTRVPHGMDLLDCFTYGVMIGLGNSSGF